jgi:regulator of sirC expression with transglutaminase-like and TPR domain
MQQMFLLVAFGWENECSAPILNAVMRAAPRSLKQLVLLRLLSGQGPIGPRRRGLCSARQGCPHHPKQLKDEQLFVQQLDRAVQCPVLRGGMSDFSMECKSVRSESDALLDVKG